MFILLLKEFQKSNFRQYEQMKSRAGKKLREEEDQKKEEQKRKRKKKNADARKGRKVAKHCVFPIICGSEGSKSRFAKVAGTESAGQMSNERLHAVVARNTFRSQNTSVSDHFQKFRCRKSTRRSSAKYISKSKYIKHTIFGPLLEVKMLKSACRCGAKYILPLLEVRMSKKYMPLQYEIHFQVKIYKILGVRPIFRNSNVEKMYAVMGQRTFRSKHVQNTRNSNHFWKFSYRFISIHYKTLHYTTLHYTTLHYTTLQLQLHNYTPLHSTTLNYTTLHYITLHYTPLHYITLHCTTFHYTSLHHTTLPRQKIDRQIEEKEREREETCRSISGFALPSLIHNNQFLLQVSYF